MKINNRRIGMSQNPFVIAEISGNHDKNYKKLMKLIDAAKYTNADAVKIQTYKPNTITINSKRKEFKISNKNSLWNGSNLYDLYDKAHTPWEWHKDIFDYAKEKKILIFSSVFDETSIDLLEKLDCPCYKIASFENNHYPLIELAISTKKPVIVSTGMASLKELKEIYELFKKNKHSNFAFLKCTSTYPANPVNSNLRTISDLRKKFKCEIGLSDHTLGIGASISSIVHGASIIEKHITLSRKDNSVDSAFSLEPQEFKQLVLESNIAWKAMGKITYGPSSHEEKKSLKHRRSIYFIRDLNANHKITENDIQIIRPANGLEPKYLRKILGKKTIRKVYKGSPTNFRNLK